MGSHQRWHGFLVGITATWMVLLFAIGYTLMEYDNWPFQLCGGLTLVAGFLFMLLLITESVSLYKKGELP